MEETETEKRKGVELYKSALTGSQKKRKVVSVAFHCTLAASCLTRHPIQLSILWIVFFREEHII